MSHSHSLIASQTQLQCQRVQQDEFQILPYIYLDEFHIIKEHLPYKFSVMIRPYLPKHQFEYQISIHFEYTKTYPKTPIKYDIEPITGITRDNFNTITKKIEDLIYDNREKPIVYDIVEEIRNWIVEYLVQGKAPHDAELQMHKKNQEIFQRPKFAAFTPVTFQSFLAWKKQFDARNAKSVTKKEGEAKLTGKQWFLGKKVQEIEESEEEEDQSDDEDYEEKEEEENNPNNYDEPENRLFMMNEEEIQGVNQN